ncbi:MAG: HEAT repeat domain-containing protein [Candidatus Omnitrophica bacterium]|nr:HEAT repeat domain-containing protein [Candidatus Omnitrophota bacterium]
MDGKVARHEDIKGLIAELLSPKGLKSEEAFESLSFHLKDEDIDFVYSSFMRDKKPHNIYWLVRYLAGIERPYGFEKLFLLAGNENEFIWKEALAGIARIDPDSRTEIFIKMLEFKREEEICFAIKGLGDLRAQKAVIPLLGLLKKYDSNDNIKIAIAQALGSIGGRRAFVALEDLIENSKDTVKDASLAAFNRLTRVLAPGNLSKYLMSENRQIREIAYRSASRMPYKRGERYLADGLAVESEESVKLNILSWINSIDSERLFRAVLGIALKSKFPRVMMMARSAIRKAKSPRMLRYLMREENAADGEKKILLMRFLAEYRGALSTARIFVKNYSRSEDNKIKLITIESLGEAGDKKYAPFLKDIVKANTRFSYAAALALTHLIDKSGWGIVDEMLSLAESTFSGTVQVFLRFVLTLPYDYSLPETVKARIEALSRSKSHHIRYLAARCLPSIKTCDISAKIAERVQDDGFSRVRDAYTRSLAFLLEKNPDELSCILDNCACNQKIPFFYYGLFRKIVTSKEGFIKITKELLRLINEHIAKPPPKSALYAIRLMVLLKIQALKGRSFFLEYLAREKMSETEYWVMMRVINATDIHQFRGLDIDFMATQYKNAPVEAKIEYLNFFKRMSVKSKPIERVVFEGLRTEKSEFIRKKISDIISNWMEESKESTGKGA